LRNFVSSHEKFVNNTVLLLTTPTPYRGWWWVKPKEGITEPIAYRKPAAK